MQSPYAQFSRYWNSVSSPYVDLHKLCGKLCAIWPMHISTLKLVFDIFGCRNHSSMAKFLFNPSKIQFFLHFYLHDIVTSKNPTAIPITKPGITNSSTNFGEVFMADDPLTVEPDINSKLVGRAQGMYAFASQTEFGLLMVFNLVFSEGKYNGSTLSLLGHNAIFSGVREMPIVGGSKIFRFARGYALAKTHTIDLKTKNGVEEYNVYVLHY